MLLTADDVTRRSHYRNAHQTFAKLLELGVLPIVNENDTVATSEIRFGDNDRLAALVAHLVHADLLVLLSDVDGLYDGHPAAEGSRLIADVALTDDLAGVRIGTAGAAGVGTGGMRTKLDAARIATGAGIPVVLTSADQAGDALAGEPVGTWFHAADPAPPDPAAVAGPRHRAQGRAAARRGRRPGGHRAPRLAARRRAHRRDRLLRRRRPGRPGRARRGRRRPRPGQLRRRRDPARWSAGPRPSSGASSGRRTSARSCTATTSSCSDAVG